EAVAREQQQRLLQPEMRKRAGSGRQFALLVEEDFRKGLRSTRVKVDLGSLLHSPRRLEELELRIDPPRRAKPAWRRQLHPPLDRRVLDPRQIHGRALSRKGALHRLSSGLHATYPQPLSRRIELHF